MDAVVLVGGEGTRLRPLTYDTPKQMLPVVDRPMIEHVVEWLASHGIDRVVLSLGYRPDAFLEAFPSGECEGVRLVYAIEPELLDTAGAIGFAARTAGIETTFLVLNGDVLSDFDVSSLVAFHRDRRAETTIQLTPVEDPSFFGVVPTDETGRVTAFIEKPVREAAPTNLINAGCYVVEPTVLDRIPAGRRVSIERETFPALVEAGALFAVASDAYWLDTGTPEKYIQASLDILHGLRTKRSEPRTAKVAPGLFVDPSAEVSGDLLAPALVGRGVVVEEGAHVVDTVLLDGARVAAGARVVGSIVMAGAQIRDGVLVESSIVGPGSTIGRGSVIREASVVGTDAVLSADMALEGARYPAA